MNSFKQLVELSENNNIKKQHFPPVELVGRPRAIRFQDRKLFLRIFTQVRKKLKRGNQFAVIEEMKRLIEYEYQDKNLDSVDGEKDIAECGLVKIIKVSRKDYHKSYGRDNYLNAYEIALNQLANYIQNATPSAIIQMRKRLLKNK